MPQPFEIPNELAALIGKRARRIDARGNGRAAPAEILSVLFYSMPAGDAHAQGWHVSMKLPDDNLTVVLLQEFGEKWEMVK